MAAMVAISLGSLQVRVGDSPLPFGSDSLWIRHSPHGGLAALEPYKFIRHRRMLISCPPCSPLTPRCSNPGRRGPQLPNGALNLSQDGRKTGQTVTQAPGQDGLLLTGSSRADEALPRHFAGRPEFLLALEISGNGPYEVSEMTHLEAALYLIIQFAFLSARQRLHLRVEHRRPEHPLGHRIDPLPLEGGH